VRDTFEYTDETQNDFVQKVKETYQKKATTSISCNPNQHLHTTKVSQRWLCTSFVSCMAFQSNTAHHYINGI